jgi:thymidylate kinase
VKDIYIVEGLDRLGKGTLIQGIQNQFGFYQVIHFSKPQVLDKYRVESSTATGVAYGDFRADVLYRYQRDSFKNMFRMMMSNVPSVKIIFDRAHLGEAVYSNMYRGYDGNYVFDIEREYAADMAFNVRLILLTEAFETSKHFVEDGESFDPTKREEEQMLFLNAFAKSIIPDKRIICVTDKSTGQFRNKQEILQEAISK